MTSSGMGTGAALRHHVQEVHVYENTCANWFNMPWKSYRENGWGSHSQRVTIYNTHDCVEGGLLFSTWAYDGDFFKSGQCYNVKDHTARGAENAYALGSQAL